jgi:hypothetical protein
MNRLYYYAASFWLLAFGFSSCIHTSEIMHEKRLLLSYDKIQDCEVLHFDLHHGGIDSISKCMIGITFYQARGGRNYLFGKMIADHSPRTQNIVKVFRNNVQIASLSYVDILALPSVMQDSSEVFQFLLPN